MSESTRGQPDVIRKLGFESVYRLPQSEEVGAGLSTPTPDADEQMKTFTPEQRDRVFNVAARRLAFQLLYQLDALDAKEPREHVRSELARVEELGPVAAEKVEAMVMGAFGERSQADADFAAIAPQWPAHRQPGVDRAILRLAHYELLHAINPPRIAINEAVELARHFSTEKSPAFVNGLLDKVAQRVPPAASASGPASPKGGA